MERVARPGYSVAIDGSHRPIRVKQAETYTMTFTLPTTTRRYLATFALAGLLVGPGAADAQQLPYEAQIIDNRVEVRSGAGRAFYPVAELSRGERVTVVDEQFLWYMVECPETVFCYVDRKNVDAKGDGSRGIVNTDRTEIYIAHATKGPADSYRNLKFIDAGEEVRILETVNNSYKIAPPEGTLVFLPPDSVEPVGNAPAPGTPAPETPVEAPAEVVAPPTAVEEPAPVEIVVPEPPVVVAPVVPSPTKPEPVVAAADPPAEVESMDVPVTEIMFDEPAAPRATRTDLLNDPDVKVPLPDVEVATQAEHEMLRAVEVAIRPYFTLPVDRQPIAKMVRGYADAAQLDGLSDNDLAIIQARLTELERNRELAEAMKQIDTSSAEVNDGELPDKPETPAVAVVDAGPEVMTEGTPAAPAAAREAAATPDAVATTEAPAEAAPEATAPPTPPAVAVPASEYDAVGILTASTVHTGGDQPQLLRLLDPTGRRTVAYLEPGGEVDTVQMIGRLVGIVGDAVYDPTTKLNLIQPTRVDILNAQ